MINVITMTQEEKREFLRTWFSDEDMNQASKILDTIDTSKQETEHSIEISERELFGNIDASIELLEKLKKDGYTEIEQVWIGYETNCFRANKIESETTEEWYQRLFQVVYKKITEQERRIEHNKEIKRQIKSKQDEINKLKNQLL